MLRSRSLFSKLPKIKCSRPSTVSYNFVNHELNVSSRNSLHTSIDYYNKSTSDYYSQKYTQNLYNNTHLQDKHKLTSINQLDTKKNICTSPKIARKNRFSDNQKSTESYNVDNNITNSNALPKTQRTTYSDGYLNSSNQKVPHMSRKDCGNNKIINKNLDHLKYESINKKQETPPVIDNFQPMVKSKNVKRSLSYSPNNIKTNGIKNNKNVGIKTTDLRLCRNDITSDEINNVEILESDVPNTIELNQFKPNNQKLSKQNDLYNKYLKQEEHIKCNSIQLKQAKNTISPKSNKLYNGNTKIRSSTDPAIKLNTKSQNNNKRQIKGNSTVQSPSKTTINSVKTSTFQSLEQNNDSIVKQQQNIITNNKTLSKNNNLYMDYLKQDTHIKNNVSVDKYSEYNDVVDTSQPKISFHTNRPKIKSNIKSKEKSFNNKNKKVDTDLSLIGKQTEIKATYNKRSKSAIQFDKSVKSPNLESSRPINKCQNKTKNNNAIINHNMLIKPISKIKNLNKPRVSISKIQTEAKKLYSNFLKSEDCNKKKDVYTVKSYEKEFNLNPKTNKGNLNTFQDYQTENLSSENMNGIKKTKAYSKHFMEAISDPGIFRKPNTTPTHYTCVPSNLKSPKSYNITKRASSTHNCTQSVKSNKKADGEQLNYNNNFQNYSTKSGRRLVQSKSSLVKTKINKEALEPSNLVKYNSKSSSETKSQSIKSRDQTFRRSVSSDPFTTKSKNKFETLSNDIVNVHDQKKDIIRQFNTGKHKYEQLKSGTHVNNNRFTENTNAILDIETESPNDYYDIQPKKSKLQDISSIPSYEKTDDLEDILDTELVFLKSRPKYKNFHITECNTGSKLNEVETLNIETKSDVKHDVSDEVIKTVNKVPKESGNCDVQENKSSLIKQQKSDNADVKPNKSVTRDKYNKYKEQFQVLEQSSLRNDREGDITNSFHGKTSFTTFENKQESIPHTSQTVSRFPKHERLTNAIISKMGSRNAKVKKSIPVKFTTSVCITNNTKQRIPSRLIQPPISRREPRDLSKLNITGKEKVGRENIEKTNEKLKEIKTVENNKKEYKPKSIQKPKLAKKPISPRKPKSAPKPKPALKPKAVPKPKSAPKPKSTPKPKSVEKPKLSETIGEKEEHKLETTTFKTKGNIKNDNKSLKKVIPSQVVMKKKQTGKDNPEKGELENEIVSKEIAENLQKFRALSSTIPNIVKKLLEHNKKDLEADVYNTSEQEKVEKNTTKKSLKLNTKYSNQHDHNIAIENKGEDSILETEALQESDVSKNMEDTIDHKSKGNLSKSSTSHSMNRKKSLPKLFSKQKSKNSLLEKENSIMKSEILQEADTNKNVEYITEIKNKENVSTSSITDSKNLKNTSPKLFLEPKTINSLLEKEDIIESDRNKYIEDIPDNKNEENVSKSSTSYSKNMKKTLLNLSSKQKSKNSLLEKENSILKSEILQEADTNKNVEYITDNENKEKISNSSVTESKNVKNTPPKLFLEPKTINSLLEKENVVESDRIKHIEDIPDNKNEENVSKSSTSHSKNLKKTPLKLSSKHKSKNSLLEKENSIIKSEIIQEADSNKNVKYITDIENKENGSKSSVTDSKNLKNTSPKLFLEPKTINSLLEKENVVESDRIKYIEDIPDNKNEGNVSKSSTSYSKNMKTTLLNLSSKQKSKNSLLEKENSILKSEILQEADTNKNVEYITDNENKEIISKSSVTESKNTPPKLFLEPKTINSLLEKENVVESDRIKYIEDIPDNKNEENVSKSSTSHSKNLKKTPLKLSSKHKSKNSLLEKENSIIKSEILQEADTNKNVEYITDNENKENVPKSSITDSMNLKITSPKLSSEPKTINSLLEKEDALQESDINKYMEDGPDNKYEDNISKSTISYSKNQMESSSTLFSEHKTKNSVLENEDSILETEALHESDTSKNNIEDITGNKTEENGSTFSISNLKNLKSTSPKWLSEHKTKNSLLEKEDLIWKSAGVSQGSDINKYIENIPDNKNEENVSISPISHSKNLTRPLSTLSSQPKTKNMPLEIDDTILETEILVESDTNKYTEDSRVYENEEHVSKSSISLFKNLKKPSLNLSSEHKPKNSLLDTENFDIQDKFLNNQNETPTVPELDHCESYETNEIENQNYDTNMNTIEESKDSLSKIDQSTPYPETRTKNTLLERKNIYKTNAKEKNKVKVDITDILKQDINQTENENIIDKNEIIIDKSETKSVKSKLYHSNKLRKSPVKSSLNTKSSFLETKALSKNGQDQKHVHQQNIFKNEIPNILSLNYHEKPIQMFIDLEQKPILLDKFANLITNIEPMLKKLPEPSILDPPIGVFKKIKYSPFKNLNLLKKDVDQIDKDKVKYRSKISYINKLSTRLKTATDVKPTTSSDIIDNDEYFEGSQNEANTEVPMVYSKSQSQLLHLQNPPMKLDEEVSKRKVNQELFSDETYEYENEKFTMKKESSSSRIKNKGKKKSDTNIKDPLSVNQSLNKRTKPNKVTTMSLKGKKHYRLLTTTSPKQHTGTLKNSDKVKLNNFYKTEIKEENMISGESRNCDIKINNLEKNEENLSLVKNSLSLKNINEISTKTINKIGNDCFNMKKIENSSEVKMSKINNSNETDVDQMEYKKQLFSYNPILQIPLTNKNITSLDSTIANTSFNLKPQVKGTSEVPNVETSNEFKFTKSETLFSLLESNLEMITKSICEKKSSAVTKHDQTSSDFIKDIEIYSYSNIENKPYHKTSLDSLPQNSNATFDHASSLLEDVKETEKEIPLFLKDQNQFKVSTSSHCMKESKVDNPKPQPFISEEKNEVKTPSPFNNEIKITVETPPLYKDAHLLSKTGNKIDPQLPNETKMEKMKSGSKTPLIFKGEKESEAQTLQGETVFQVNNNSTLSKEESKSQIENNIEIKTFSFSHIEKITSFPKSEKETEIGMLAQPKGKKLEIEQKEENKIKSDTTLGSKDENKLEVRTSSLKKPVNKKKIDTTLDSKYEQQTDFGKSSLQKATVQKKIESPLGFKDKQEMELVETSSSQKTENKIKSETALGSKNKKQIEFGKSSFQKSEYNIIKRETASSSKNKTKTDLRTPLIQKLEKNIESEATLGSADKKKIEFGKSTFFNKETKDDKTKINDFTNIVIDDMHKSTLKQNYNLSNKNSNYNYDNSVTLISETKSGKNIMSKDDNTKSLLQKTNKSKVLDTIYDPKAKYEKTFFLPSNIKIIYSPTNLQVESHLKVNNEKESVNIKKGTHKCNNLSQSDSNNETNNQFLKIMSPNNVNITSNHCEIPNNSNSEIKNIHNLIDDHNVQCKSKLSASFVDENENKSSLMQKQESNGAKLKCTKTEIKDVNLSTSKLSEKTPTLSGVYSYKIHTKLNTKHLVELHNHSKNEKIIEVLDTSKLNNTKIKRVCSKINYNETIFSRSKSDGNLVEGINKGASSTTIDRVCTDESVLQDVQMIDEMRSKKSFWMNSIFPNNKKRFFKKEGGKLSSVKCNKLIQSNESTSKLNEENVESTIPRTEHKLEPNPSYKQPIESNLKLKSIIGLKQNIENKTTKKETRSKGIKKIYWTESVLPKYQEISSNRKKVGSEDMYNHVLKQIKSESMLKLNTKTLENFNYKAIDNNITFSKSPTLSNELIKNRPFSTKKTPTTSTEVENENKQDDKIKDEKSKRMLWLESIFQKHKKNLLERSKKPESIKSKSESSHSVEFSKEKKRKENLNPELTKSENILNFKLNNSSTLKQKENTQKLLGKLQDKKSLWMETVLPKYQDKIIKKQDSNANNHTTDTSTKINNKIENMNESKISFDHIENLSSTNTNQTPFDTKSSKTSFVQEEKNKSRDLKMINEINRNPLWIETALPNSWQETDLKKEVQQQTQNITPMKTGSKISVLTLDKQNKLDGKETKLEDQGKEEFATSKNITSSQSKDIKTENIISNENNKSNFQMQSVFLKHQQSRLEKDNLTVKSERSPEKSSKIQNEQTKDVNVTVTTPITENTIQNTPLNTSQECTDYKKELQTFQSNKNINFSEQPTSFVSKINDTIEETKNKNLFWIQCDLPKCNEITNEILKKDQAFESKWSGSSLLLSNLSSKEDHEGQGKNTPITVVKSVDIALYSDDIKTKLSTESIIIGDQGVNKAKRNVVIFERNVQQSALSHALKSLNNTLSTDKSKIDKETKSYVLDDVAKLNKKERSNENQTIISTTKQYSALDNRIHNEFKTEKPKIIRPRTANDAIFLEKFRVNKNINLSDSDALIPKTKQLLLKHNKSIGKIDVALTKLKVNEDDALVLKSAFLVLQGDGHTHSLHDSKLQSMLTQSANEAQITGEFEIACKKKKGNEENINKLKILEYKHNITSLLKDPTIVLSSNKVQNQLTQHVVRAKSLINKYVKENSELQQLDTKTKQVKEYNDGEGSKLNLKKTKAETLYPNSEKHMNLLKDNEKSHKDVIKNQDSKSRRKSSYYFQYMKNKKYGAGKSNKTDKSTSKKLNNIINDVKKTVNVTINDHHEKPRYLKLTPKNIKKVTENIEFEKESVKMIKAPAATEDDKKTKGVKNREHFPNEMLLTHKSPIIIIDKIKAVDIKNLIKEVEVSSIPPFEISKSKSHSKIDNYPLENDKRSKTYYPLVIINIKTVKLEDLSPEAQRFPIVNDVLNYTFGNTNIEVDVIKRKKKVAGKIGEDVPQSNYDLMSQEVVFKKLLQAFLLGDNSKMNEKCLHSLEWTWPFFTSVSAVNTNTVHPELLYRGVIECIAKFKDHPVLIEWKLSKLPKVKPILPQEAAIRLSALMGALNYDYNFNFQVNKGIIILAYASGDPADIFVLSSRNCQIYWKMWLTHLKKYPLAYNTSNNKQN